MKPDQNPQSFFGLEHVVVFPWPAVAEGATDTVKFSRCHNLLADGRGQLFESGAEQVIDVVRCRDLTLVKFRLRPGAQNAITLKGWVNGYTLEDIVLLHHSAGAQDIDLGNWSDYDRTALLPDGTPLRWLPRTTGGMLRRVRMADGSRVRVRCLYADRPALEDSEVEWVNAVPGIPNSITTAVYFTAKRRGLLSTRKPPVALATLAPWEVAALADPCPPP